MATAAKKTPPDVLDVGDKIAYRVSSEVKADGHNAWVGMEMESTVRQGETAEEARYRISDFVHAQLTDAIAEVIAG